ncbi:MAG: chemotaxis response regulator protein-glutamate methylesterase [Clostridiales Family XIII bacterium]|jgi:two-component system chemotaxis response regulator CheB|nr:chemotaxis response regulator protein-glutamate methylesterase [Clostridiales Family XIII bacterium]
MIRTLIIDDSLLFRELLSRGLKDSDDIEVAGHASDPFSAAEQILELEPDVVTLDVEMPKMDGVKFLRKLMPQYPLPVIVISSVTSAVFEALDAGALDFLAKPIDLSGDMSTFFFSLRSKVRAASQAKFAFRKQISKAINLEQEGLKGEIDPRSIIAIGASTGGTDAIGSILTKFTANMPGIVVAQHMPPGFTSLYAERLSRTTNFDVREAHDGMELVPGRVLIAPGDHHMTVARFEDRYRVNCHRTPKVNGHRPSVDVLFESVAASAGAYAIGVILTGMGSDGADGLKKIRDYGGITIGQDENTSVVYGMPMAAHMLGGVMIQLPLYRIADEIFRLLSLSMGR